MRLDRHQFYPDAIESTRTEFSRRGCAILNGFLDPDLARWLAQRLESAVYVPTAHYSSGAGIGADLSGESSDATLHALHLLLNNSQLFDAIERVTGVQGVSCFAGRVYRSLPAFDQYLDWHDDCVEPLLVGLSINLSLRAYQGGAFLLRRQFAEEVAEISHSICGSAHIFEIRKGTEHCVNPVEGDYARTAFAGWFRSSPDRRTLLRSLFLCPAASESAS